MCLYLPEAKELFSGDTLFSGGPGATGRSYSDFPTIIGSIRDRLFALPVDTRVNTGHGDGNEDAAASRLPSPMQPPGLPLCRPMGRTPTGRPTARLLRPPLASPPFSMCVVAAKASRVVTLTAPLSRC